MIYLYSIYSVYGVIYFSEKYITVYILSTELEIREKYMTTYTRYMTPYDRAWDMAVSTEYMWSYDGICQVVRIPGSDAGAESDPAGVTVTVRVMVTVDSS